MRILWHNIVVFALLILVIVLLLRHSECIKAVVGTMQHIGPGHSSDEQTLGLITLGIICVSIAAIAKILTNKNQR